MKKNRFIKKEEIKDFLVYLDERENKTLTQVINDSRKEHCRRFVEWYLIKHDNPLNSIDEAKPYIKEYMKVRGIHLFYSDMEGMIKLNNTLDEINKKISLKSLEIKK